MKQKLWKWEFVTDYSTCTTVLFLLFNFKLLWYAKYIIVETLSRYLFQVYRAKERIDMELQKSEQSGSSEPKEPKT